jgi:serine/threonine protein kinase
MFGLKINMKKINNNQELLNISNYNNIKKNNIYNKDLIYRLKIFNTSNIIKQEKSILQSRSYYPILQSTYIQNISIYNFKLEKTYSNENMVLLNEGSFSKVYKLNDKIIIKFIKYINNDIDILELKSILFNFYLQGISTEYICKIYEYGIKSDKYIYSIIEYCGENLLQLPNILNFQELNKTNLLLLLNIFIQCILAVNFIHSLEFVHLDIKPENLLIHFNCLTKEFNIKIIDFGTFDKIGNIIKYIKGTIINKLIKKNILNKNVYTFTYDIYSLGQTFIMLYFNIIENIFNQSEYFRGISNEIYKVLYKMISPYRNGRDYEYNTIKANFFNSNNYKNITKKYTNLTEKRYSTLDEVIIDFQLIINRINS